VAQSFAGLYARPSKMLSLSDFRCETDEQVSPKLTAPSLARHASSLSIISILGHHASSIASTSDGNWSRYTSEASEFEPPCLSGDDLDQGSARWVWHTGVDLIASPEVHDVERETDEDEGDYGFDDMCWTWHTGVDGIAIQPSDAKSDVKSEIDEAYGDHGFDDMCWTWHTGVDGIASQPSDAKPKNAKALGKATDGDSTAWLWHTGVDAIASPEVRCVNGRIDEEGDEGVAEDMDWTWRTGVDGIASPVSDEDVHWTWHTGVDGIATPDERGSAVHDESDAYWTRHTRVESPRPWCRHSS